MFGLKRTRTKVEISAAAYDEIIAKAYAASDSRALAEGEIVLHGVGLVRAPEPEPQPKHRPISKNTAPGAI